MLPAYVPIEKTQKTEDGWTQIVYSECPVDVKYFLEAMELLILEPNISTPAILRAEILKEFAGPHHERIRKIVPKQDRDPIILQNVRVIQEGASARVEHFVHCVGDSVESWDIVRSIICNPDELPFYYPKVQKFRYRLNEGNLSIEIIPYPGMEDVIGDPKLLKIWIRVLKFVFRISMGMQNGYKKRVHHDQIVSKIEYQDLYSILKRKYRHWKSQWPEETDPSKHVFEDIGIATFLILLWKKRPTSGKKYQFADLGCGNGFLVYILTQEGYAGYGIDISKRRIWDQFSSECKLFEKPIDCKNDTFNDVEWIIGNHPDELTLWIPIFAIKSQCNFMIIPCCFHELSGSKFTKLNPDIGRYLTYAQEIEDLCAKLGYKTAREFLRIPSTKNLCIVNQNLPTNYGEALEIIAKMIAGVDVKLRISDKRKSELLRSRHKRNNDNIII